MEVTEVANVREAVMQAMMADDKLTKYKLSKTLGLSTSTHVNNFITGKTKRTRIEVMRSFLNKYGILIEEYKNSAEYRKALNIPETEVRI